MTPEWYAEIVDKIRESGDRCGCCDVPTNLCPWWQMIRMCVDPLPGEDETINRRKS